MDPVSPVVLNFVFTRFGSHQAAPPPEWVPRVWGKTAAQPRAVGWPGSWDGAGGLGSEMWCFMCLLPRPGPAPRPQGQVRLPGLVDRLCGQLDGICALLDVCGALPGARLPGGHRKCCLGLALCSMGSRALSPCPGLAHGLIVGFKVDLTVLCRAVSGQMSRRRGGREEGREHVGAAAVPSRAWWAGRWG